MKARRTKYSSKAYCSLCQKWYPLDRLDKIFVKKFGVYVFYCPVHRKQVRLKARGRPMREAQAFSGK